MTAAAAPVPALAAACNRVALRDPVFVSDLHLSDAVPRTLARFERFVADVAAHRRELVVLGDLFEYWAGDDDDDPTGARVARLLAGLAQGGTAVYLMHGNRDLLLGVDFARRARATLIADPTLAELDGRPVLLAHGDTFCTRDVDYLRFRGLVRDPQWQREFLAQPLAQRLEFIGRARTQSEAGKREKPMALMDVTPAAVEDAMREAGVTRLVHGHTHRPAMHRFTLDGAAAERIVLPDWDFDATPVRGGYVVRVGGELSSVRLDD